MLLGRKIAKAFTLVELLVVIGIISVLISLLMPAMARARMQGNAVKCQSNLHQIGLTLQIYTNNWKGWMYPPGCGADKPHDQRWPMFAFKPAVWNPPAMICPSDTNPVEEHSYLLNSHLAEKNIRANSKNLGGRTTGEVVVMGEKQTQATDYYMDAGENFGALVELYRHGLQAGSNYLFMDWHVGPLIGQTVVIAGIDPWDVAKPSTQPAP